MRAMEILNILSKPWVSNQDIMKIADLSASTASKLNVLLREILEPSIQPSSCHHIVFQLKM